ncbi:MAG TPA: M50 family metallopeptidase [Nanoarchaeota archaeon]|nr:M50 family metallopeptidase [Candidatus Woesearchaeota archaeon]HIH58503.1 M50 family metallopeptidase [Nanoarchaeota archaeon]HII14272.1 M50 family metallopeptidase [Nanoarchaeota archaeon]HIJ05038.1 M50 family metallopeptidase [Nanoarchaeota archaeon]
MAFLSSAEILQLFVITLALGYIFSGFIQRPKDDPFSLKKFSWKDILFAASIATPAVVLHEFGHKFVAMAFGLAASFHVFWAGLVLGVLLKMIASPFLFLAPAYVSIPAGATALQSTLIAFAGPGVNLLLWGISALVLTYKKKMSEQELFAWAISRKLNLFLFWFNLIPIPPLDGWAVLLGIHGLF